MGYICIVLLFLAIMPLPSPSGVPLSMICAIAWFVLMVLARAGVWVSP